jgi:hypothetical protein
MLKALGSIPSSAKRKKERRKEGRKEGKKEKKSAILVSSLLSHRSGYGPKNLFFNK